MKRTWSALSNLDPFSRPFSSASGGATELPPENELYLLQVLDAPITIHRAFVDLTGSLNAAALLSDLAFQGDYSQIAGDWVVVDSSDWTRRIGLSYKEQLTARRMLVERGFLEIMRAGMPPVTYARVAWAAVEAALRAQSECAARVAAASVHG